METNCHAQHLQPYLGLISGSRRSQSCQPHQGLALWCSGPSPANTQNNKLSQALSLHQPAHACKSAQCNVCMPCMPTTYQSQIGPKFCIPSPTNMRHKLDMQSSAFLTLQHASQRQPIGNTISHPRHVSCAADQCGGSCDCCEAYCRFP